MKKIFVFLLLLVAARTNAQQFVNGFHVALPDSISKPEIEWVDLDNDGLLDILVKANVDATMYLITYKSDTVHGFVYQSTTNTHYQEGVFILADYDLDNDIDILLSGSSGGIPLTTVWLNQNDFTFTAATVVDQAGDVVLLSDLDADGGNELIVANNSVMIFKQAGLTWNLVSDSITIAATDISVVDIDNDFDNDVFVSGTNEAGLPVSQMYFNEGGFVFSTAFSLPFSGNLAVADLNHDGLFDFVLSGKDAGNNSRTRLLLSRNDTFVVKDSILQLSDAKIFAADFNSDGKCDLQFLGKGSEGNTVNAIFQVDADTALLPSANLVDQRFGDFDNDGDLDLIQLVQGSTTFELIHVDNTTDIVNQGPGVPADAIGFQLYDRAFIYWSKVGDDHTPSVSITYDLTFQTSMKEQMIGSFDMLHLKRLTVSHGNIGARNFAFFKSKDNGFQFMIQAVDNAFHAGDGGVCTGGGSSLCGDVVPEMVTACKNQNVILAADQHSMWFSFRDGMIGNGPSLMFAASALDTVFAFTPRAASGCATVKLFTIQIGTGIIDTINTTRYACDDQTITFEADPSWVDVTWSSYKRGFLSNDHSIQYQVAQSDTVKALFSNADGCLVQHNTRITISKPELQLDGEVFQILRGQSVQLSASGGETYAWTPSTGLDNPQSAQPVASPVTTTLYQVAVTDSIGCTAEGQVMVMVEGTAFIPNLFTPNSDGRNDEVKIYGLSSAKNFQFSIHNREGNTVYETRDVQQAVSVGWNGTNRGSPLPSGVYYWKVRGEQQSGTRLLLNGKSNGTIVLIR